MNETPVFEAWAARARQEPVPPLDVAEGVLRRIESVAPRAEINSSWLVCCGISVLAASLMLAAATNGWQALTDPLAGLFSSLTMVMQ